MDKKQDNQTRQQSIVTRREELQEPQVFERFKKAADQIIEQKNVEGAMEARFVLEDMLLGEYPELEIANPDLYKNYQNLIARLKFVILSTRPLPEVQKLMRTRLSLAIKSKIDLRDQLDSVLRLYNDLIMEGKIAESLGKALQENPEKLSDKKIKLRGKENPVDATIGNFVLDYRQNTLAPPGKYKPAGTLERITYTNQNENARKLDPDQKDVLLKVLELYDWFRFGPEGVSKDPEKRYVRKTKDRQAYPTLKELLGTKSTPSEITVDNRSDQVGAKSQQKPEVKEKPSKGVSKPVMPTPPAPITKKRTSNLLQESRVNPPSPPARKKVAEKKVISSLDELKKMRDQYEAQKSSIPPAPKQRAKKLAELIKRETVSVNEAIIEEGTKRNRFRGEMVGDDSEIEKKLKNLEKKLDKKDS